MDPTTIASFGPLCDVPLHASSRVLGLRRALSAGKDEFSALMMFFEEGLERTLLWLGQRVAHP